MVREVLRHLEAEGLVETLAYQGPIVARLDVDTVDQIYELRTVVEVLATRACAERISDRELAGLEKTLQAVEEAFQNMELGRTLEETTHFYATIFTSAGKTVAWDVFRNLNARVNQLRAMTLASVAGSRSGVGETRRILQAIRDRNPDAAERACRAHVEYAHGIARQQLMTLQAG